jgi:hypothetical protein
MARFPFRNLALLRQRYEAQPKALATSTRFYLPAMAFLGGFLWDAFTLGRYVRPVDLIILGIYLFIACGITLWLGKRHAAGAADEATMPVIKLRAPYLLLQFLFGSLLSALFILYFRSASHLMAIAWTSGLALLLIANEFLEDHYKRLTLSWALLGFCAILLFNFSVPFVIGSIHATWFYCSTLIGALLIHWLHERSGRAGRILFVWIIAGVLSAAYLLDAIPPVPLVKRDMQIGIQLESVDGKISLMAERPPIWALWNQLDEQIHVPAGEKLYCVSSVFAPIGLKTKLFHRWEFKDAKQGWVTMSHIGFDLEGGREQGFRGYTYKQNVQPGKWRVAVETENGRTVTVYHFTIKPAEAAASARLIKYDVH